ncbi:cytochrome P450 [Streptomyces sp. NPDC058464]|uniref:cytochrome P450 n=1 Tax=Streptomyces sp. NPDC058464 TaxID=3346511 RepID=UPI00364DE5A9
MLPDNPWAQALRDLRLDVGERATDVQTERWVQANVEYFDGLLWEAANRAEGRIPSLDDYVAMWLKQSGVYPCVVFTDIACGYEVPAADWAGRRARTLREMTAVLIGWDNDLTSYDKEVARAAERNFPVVQNLVSVLAAQYALPAGTGLAYSPYLLHRDPGVFADPDRFDPDRWLPERAASVSKDAFVPFGGGVHKCIGDTFGMTEATLALATIAARWTLTPEFRGPVEPAPRRATLSPARLPMRVAGRP